MNKERHRVTVQDLIGLSLPADLTVSPDGTHLAVAISEVDFAHGEHDVQLHLVQPPDLPEPAEPGPAETEAEETAPEAVVRQLTRGLGYVTAPAWSPDGGHIAFITFRPQPHEDEEDDQREDGTEKEQIFLLPAEGGEARRLTEAAEGVDAYRWAADGQGIYFIGRAPRPLAERGWHRRRRDSKDDAVVAHGDIPTIEFWYQPLEGRAQRLLGGVRGIDSFAISPDDRWLAYATNHTGRTEHDDRTEIILRDLETGEERRLTNGRGGAELSPVFTPDGRFLLFEGWADPKLAFSRQMVFAVDLHQPEAPPRALLAALDRDIEEFVPLSDGRVAILVAWGMESRLVLTDPATDSWEIVPLTGKYLSQLDAAAKELKVALVAEDRESLPQAGWVDLTSGIFEPLTDLNSEAKEWRRGERRVLTWSNEGFDHEGLLLLPAPEDRRGSNPPPLLVWLHGGPHWRVVDTLRVYEAEAFAAEGWAVWMPQYRGSSGYAELYQTAIRGDLGGAEVRDILTGLDRLAETGLVDVSRSAVGGASYGGYLTNWLLATTDRFKAGVSIAGIFDLGQDFSTSEFGGWEVYYLGGTPWEKPDLYRERSPLTYAASIQAPLLILHGLEDENTFVTNGKALYRALSTLGRTVEFVVYPREGHGLSEPPHRLDEAQRILEWISRHVVGGIPPRLTGRAVDNCVVSLTLLGSRTNREYNGVRPAAGRVFCEVSVLLRAREGGPESLRLVPAGPECDVVLRDGRGDLFRPIGIPIEIHGQELLLSGSGVLEAFRGEDGRPPSLPSTSVFELPDEAAGYELRVQDLPPLLVQIFPEPDDEEEEPTA